jgi:hypothetical protein
MGFGSEPANSTFGDWAVADGGKTLVAHSELFEGRHDQRWIGRLSFSSTIRFKFDAEDSTFKTGQLAHINDGFGNWLKVSNEIQIKPQRRLHPPQPSPAHD